MNEDKYFKVHDDVPLETTRHILDHCLCLHLQRAARVVARRLDEAFRSLHAKVSGRTVGRARMQIAARHGNGCMPEGLLDEVDGRTPAEAVAGMRERSRRERRGLLTRTPVIVSEFRVPIQANKPSARDRSERQRDRLRAATAPTPPTPDAGAHPFLDAEIGLA